MKSKTIKSVLRRKVDHWCQNIEDESVRKLVAENTIITGGAIVSMLLNEPVNDYDVYLRTPEAVYAVASYYLEKFKQNPPVTFKGDDATCIPMYLADGHRNSINLFSQWKRDDELSSQLKILIKSAGVACEDGQDDYEYFEASPDPSNAGEFVENAASVAEAAKESDLEKGLYRPVFLTSNAITLSDKVQVVLRFYGEADEIHKNYDYVHCTNYWQSWDGKLQLHADALECILNRELRYVGSKYPVCSVFRLRKFIERGWRVNAGQILKACLQISQLDLTNARVLEDQLTGVDAAYFNEVIRLCQKRMEETQSDRIDYAYLIELIDRIF